MIKLTIEVDDPDVLFRLLGMDRQNQPIVIPVAQAVQHQDSSLVAPPIRQVDFAPVLENQPAVDSISATKSIPPEMNALDTTGLPWDGRIHSCGRTRHKDGRWRNKRNIDPALLEAVTQELRAKQSSPALQPVESDDRDQPVESLATV